MPSLGVAGWPLTVEGLHVVGLGVPIGVGVEVGVLPLGQVLTVTVQAELLILFVLDAVTVELEVLSAEFVFMFVFGSRSFLKSCFLLAKEFCIIEIILVAPTTSIDVITTTIMMPWIVWFILSFTSTY